LTFIISNPSLFFLVPSSQFRKSKFKFKALCACVIAFSPLRWEVSLTCEIVLCLSVYKGDLKPWLHPLIEAAAYGITSGEVTHFVVTHGCTQVVHNLRLTQHFDIAITSEAYNLSLGFT